MITKKQIELLKDYNIKADKIDGLISIYNSDENFFSSIGEILKEPEFMRKYFSLLKIADEIGYQSYIKNSTTTNQNEILFTPTSQMIWFNRFVREGNIFFSRSIPEAKWKHLGEEQFEILKRLLKEQKLEVYEDQSYYKEWDIKVDELADELRKSGELIDP